MAYEELFTDLLKAASLMVGLKTTPESSGRVAVEVKRTLRLHVPVGSDYQSSRSSGVVVVKSL
jgi:hypothetical protein